MTLVSGDNPEHFDDVLAMANVDVDEVEHAVASNADAIYTWDYQKGERLGLEKLYEKAKGSQWNGQTDLDWTTNVDPEQVAAEMAGGDHRSQFVKRLIDSPGSPISSWGDKEILQYEMETFAHRLSQFTHGEQGALICTAKIVETVPWIDAKYYAATQVVDEARHVEVFSQYLDTKWPSSYPISVHLRALLDDIVNDTRWDMTYLGMQIMVEGLALAAFGFMHQMCTEPLLKKLLRYVMADEARHVAFGVLSLQEYYQELTQAEILDRQQFAFEATIRMRDRFLQQEVWDRMGGDTKAMVRVILDMPAEEKLFQQMLFSKIVPNCRKLGLLDAGDGWLRERYQEIGIIEFENYVDTAVEYEVFDLAQETES
ncbi:MAG: ferritin-like domain-containing protein [Acidimicrobiales bacterium]